MEIHEVFAYLRASDAKNAIEFYKTAFGATEKFRLVADDGRIGHCELLFGNTTIMLSDGFPEFDIHAQGPEGESGFSIHLHVDDADAVIAKACKAGARILREPEDHEHGERGGTIRDPFGFDWMIGHSIEDVSTEEMQRRYSESSAAN
ncbi:VOC family protein [Notoacmeibacter marinus]|uniref:VOC family protein n=1 Tax=Notoacmeibacter marinus TaxID=1876515 RepID=UPI000DF27C26|nr:VOC family protein [Notoacmeibacter marinus]